MTDQPLSSRAHPSPDELADLRAGVLEASRSAEVATHVVTCGSCTDELAAMDEVAVLLSESGREPISMPADVAASLDAALARVSLERDAGVASLDEKRAERSSGRGRMAKIIPALGAAAAVFVIAGIAFNATSNQGADDSITAGGDSSDQQAESGSAAPESDRPTATDRDADKEFRRMAPQKITKHTLRTYATALSAAPTSAVIDSASEYAEEADRVCPATRLSDTVRRTPVRFEGELAYVVVKTEAHEVIVYTCESPPERLYSTSY